jgi:hypothetical protein
MTRSTFAKIRGALHRPMWRTSSINQPDAKNLTQDPAIFDSSEKTETRCGSWHTYGNR